MAIHLTPTELAEEVNMKRREVISKCMEMGVPIFNGRIDKTLFVSSKQAQGVSAVREGGLARTRLSAPPHALHRQGGRGTHRIASAVPPGRGGDRWKQRRPPPLPRGTGSKTMADMGLLAARKYGDSTAITHKVGDEWVKIDLCRSRDRHSEIGRGLIDLGVAPRDKVAILANSRPEWVFDFATLATGAASWRSTRPTPPRSATTC